MYAWAIRKERHGPPESSFQVEVLPTWEIADDEVLVLVMAAGVNYNGVWAGNRHAGVADRRPHLHHHRGLRVTDAVVRRCSACGRNHVGAGCRCVPVVVDSETPLTTVWATSP